MRRAARLLRRARRRARRPLRLGRPLLRRRRRLPLDGRMAFDSAEGAARSTQAAPAPVSQRAESSGTGTNVQEVGVDEPDVVKTDGTTLYRVHDGTLTSYDVTGAETRRLADLDLGTLSDARDPARRRHRGRDRRRRDPRQAALRLARRGGALPGHPGAAHRRHRPGRPGGHRDRRRRLLPGHRPPARRHRPAGHLRRPARPRLRAAWQRTPRRAALEGSTAPQRGPGRARRRSPTGCPRPRSTAAPTSGWSSARTSPCRAPTSGSTPSA